MPGLNYSSGFYRFGFNGMEKDDEIKGNGNSLDFGARMLDVRLGRWFAVDPYADKYTEWSPYNFALDNPVKYVDEGGKYVVDPNFKIAYPKVSLILENADKLYNNQPLPPDVAKALRGIDVESVFNEKFRPALEKYSTLTNTRIQDVITPGQGPVISSDLLDDRERADPGGRLVNGKTLFEHDPVGNLINSNNGQGELVIDDDVAGDLEFELGGNDNGYGEFKLLLNLNKRLLRCLWPLFFMRRSTSEGQKRWELMAMTIQSQNRELNLRKKYMMTVHLGLTQTNKN